MRERTVKIGSAGKIFSLTGWKVGFVCAAPALMRVLAKAHQFITFTTPPNLQAAVAYGLGKEDAYFTGMRAGFAASRDRFSQGLTRLGLKVLPCEGTYFLNLDIAPLGEADDACLLPASRQGTRRRRDPGFRLLRGCARKDAWCGSASPRPTRRSTRRSSGSAGGSEPGYEPSGAARDTARP